MKQEILEKIIKIRKSDENKKIEKKKLKVKIPLVLKYRNSGKERAPHISLL